ncbi:guanylate kinase-associated protein mars-like isoform X1 [Drosophila subobscura]|uniref:guanylate kinase-associated protein mars-like isoform X1 n=1 Tax=Drosophila subobscura TaxID=7241 RepID=UPI00155AB8DC|nr:guanylate kinase-associated protein mars-like isoform X1 [Drosophila subobscura]
MERYYKELHKKLPFRSLRGKNMDKQKVARTMQRQDNFQRNRKNGVCSTLFENEATKLNVVAPQANKSTRKELFLKRFLKWKASKKDQTIDKQTSRRGQQVHSVPTQVYKFAYSSEIFTPPPNIQKENAPVFGPSKNQSFGLVNKPQPQSQPQPVKSGGTTGKTLIGKVTPYPAPSCHHPETKISKTKLPAVAVEPHVTSSQKRALAGLVKPKHIRGGGGAAGKLKKTQEQTKGTAFKHRPDTPVSIRMKAKNIITRGNLQRLVRNLPKLRVELIQVVCMELPPNTPFSGTKTRARQLALATSTQRRSNKPSENGWESFGNISIISPVQQTSQDKNDSEDLEAPNKALQSILTLGTTKRQHRGVGFRTKSNIRCFKFAYEEGNIRDYETAFGASKLEVCKNCEVAKRHI